MLHDEGSVMCCSDRFAVLAYPLLVCGNLELPRMEVGSKGVARTASRSSPIHLVVCGDFGLPCMEVGYMRGYSDRFAVLAHPPR